LSVGKDLRASLKTGADISAAKLRTLRAKVGLNF
jgi:hypothetical protein